jgi:hypothetical protein
MGWVLLAAVLAWSMPVRADDDADALKQAEDLVHQAWNPGGDAPPRDQQEDLLQKAIDLAVHAPQHRVHGHRVHAIELMRGALDLLKNGDADNKVPDLLRNADSELREAISEST